MDKEVTNSILKTIAYTDIFDYPLTPDQLFELLITDKKIQKETVLKTLKDLISQKIIFERDNFVHFAQRAQIIDVRLRRKRRSRSKLALAKRIAKFISLIPTVKLIGVSGNLAMQNSEKDDDIDFFIITSQNRIWITRLLCLLMLRILGKARRRRQENVSDKICINMFLSESQLFLPSRWRNIYGAHEVVQMLPLFERDNVYRRFLNANSWVSKFLSNSVDIRILRYKDTKRKEKSSPNISISQYLNIFLSVLEHLAKTAQLWYMKGHRTRELISDTLLAFHPKDYSKEILRSFEERLKKYL